MKFFFSYLKMRLPVFAVVFLFFAIFAVVFMLFRIPLLAVLYPFYLCLIIGVGVVIWDFLRTRKRHRELTGLLNTDAELLNELLPDTPDIISKDYRNIIAKLCRDYAAAISDSEARYNDMVDYYTVWAHQIKTPISAMRLHLRNEDSAISRTVTAELTRIEQYTEMVLVYLRLDSKSRDYVIRKQSLDGMIRQSVKRFSGEFIMRKLSLSYTPVDINILTDEKWFSFVIEQVLSNALKYTRSGGIFITADDDFLYIRDTGIGISPEDMPRVFEKGYTGFNGRRDRSASGIGLYLCKRICAGLGHSIDISSVVDEGTTVKIGISREKTVLE